MKREVKLLLPVFMIGLAIIFLGIGDITLQAQQTSDSEQETTTASTSKKQKTGLVEDWMSDFEACEDWRATSTSPLGDTKIRKIPGKPRPMDKDGNVVETPNEVSEDIKKILSEIPIEEKSYPMYTKFMESTIK